MHSITVTLPILFCYAFSSQSEPKDLTKVLEARLTEKSYNAVKTLHINWYILAVKALMGQLEDKRVLLRCLDGIVDEKDLVAGAKCLSHARKQAKGKFIPVDNADIAFLQEEVNRFASIQPTQKTDQKKLFNKQVYHNKYKTTNPLVQIPPPQTRTRNSLLKLRKLLKKQLLEEALKEIQGEQMQSQSVAVATDAVQVQAKKNKSKGLPQRRIFIHLQQTPPKKKIIFDIQKRKTFWESRNFTYKSDKWWSAYFRPTKVLRIYPSISNRTSRKEKNLSVRRKRNSDVTKSAITKSDNIIKQVIKMKTLDSLIDYGATRTPIQKITNLIHSIFDKTHGKNNWMDSYRKLLKFRQDMGAKRNLPGAKVYDHRLYDIVIGSKHPTKPQKLAKTFPDFLSMTRGLIDALNGAKNISDDKSIKFLSPRFAPLMPEKVPAKKRLLSPSVLSFYKDDSYDNIASIPKILEKAGLGENDQDAVLDLVMEVSGAKEVVNMSLEVLDKINFFGMEGQLYEVTKKLNNLFKGLEKSFTKEQRKEIDYKGFTFLEKQQIKDMLEGHKVKNPQDVDMNLDDYAKLSDEQRHEALWEKIEMIAENSTKSHRRKKRAVFNYQILQPFMFAPAFGPSILGPVILSPSIFSPLITNPSVLSPFILSPGVGMPFILSPYVLSPYILSPLVMAPFILTPYVLSPNILNPYVLSPLILSPYVLSPDILSPQALGGPILSPSVLSPSVLTESVLMANVLSPTFMS